MTEYIGFVVICAKNTYKNKTHVTRDGYLQDMYDTQCFQLKWSIILDRNITAIIILIGIECNVYVMFFIMLKIANQFI